MHFWIDKRSQCSYSGRHRVPSSLSAGVGRSRGRVCAAAGRKGMAAPVHRFAPVDCAPRRPRPLRHYGCANNVNNWQQAYKKFRHTYLDENECIVVVTGGAFTVSTRPPPMPAVHSTRRQNDESSLYVEIPPEPPQPTIASLAAARSVTPDTLLRTAALGLHHSPMMAPHLKFGMLVSFALATVFLAGAKYYFDRQLVRSNGGSSEVSGEVGVVCAAVACVCGVGCALSLCRSRAPPPQAPERVSSTARRPLPRTPTRVVNTRETATNETEDISLTILSRPEREREPARENESEAPPPYHIAVLLPTRGQSPPPPAYSALS